MAESALSLVERLRAALDQAQAHAEKDLWALNRATPGRWEAYYGYNLPYSLIKGEGGVEIARFAAQTGPLPDGADDLHAADILLVVRLVRKARERADVVLRTVAAHRKILDRHAECGSWIGVCDDRGGSDPEAYKAGGPGCAEIEDLASIYFPEGTEP